jgi:hypothetical protein
MSAIALIAAVDGIAFRRNLDLDRARMKGLYYVLKSKAPGSSFSFSIQLSSTDRRGQMDETTRKGPRQELTTATSSEIMPLHDTRGACWCNGGEGNRL